MGIFGKLFEKWVDNQVFECARCKQKISTMFDGGCVMLYQDRGYCESCPPKTYCKACRERGRPEDSCIGCSKILSVHRRVPRSYTPPGGG